MFIVERKNLPTHPVGLRHCLMTEPMAATAKASFKISFIGRLGEKAVGACAKI
ncbi:MAG TPA: hypothetical protein VNY05_36885 [Candidatus Acidoferrales bacterium]|nr:hypothetical protein [Candidatus Acidoferrales bacterium]